MAMMKGYASAVVSEGIVETRVKDPLKANNVKLLTEGAKRQGKRVVGYGAFLVYDGRAGRSD